MSDTGPLNRRVRSVARREFLARVRSRWFLFSTLVVPLLFLGPMIAYQETASEGSDSVLGGVRFEAYLAKPSLLGDATARRIASDGLHRTVCDYLSGMTDRYLIEEHARLFPVAPLALRS